MRTSKLALKAGLVAVLGLAADQGMKLYVRAALPLCPAPPLSACSRLDIAGPLGLVRVENAGSAFGFVQGLWLWLPLALLGLLLVPLYARKLPRAGWTAALAAGLQTGGALGNLADRLLFGAATDYIDAGWGPVFNVADIAIVAGMALAAPLLLRAAVAASVNRLTAKT